MDFVRPVKPGMTIYWETNPQPTVDFNPDVYKNMFADYGNFTIDLVQG